MYVTQEKEKHLHRPCEIMKVQSLVFFLNPCDRKIQYLWELILAIHLKAKDSLVFTH